MVSLGLGLGLGTDPGAPRDGEARVAALGPVALYDFTDASSLFVGRDGAGGNPAAGGTTSIGTALDKARMGGLTAAAFLAAQPERVSNGRFDANTSGWSQAGADAVVSWSAGRLRATRSGTTGACGVQQTVSGLVVGRAYVLTGRLAAVSNAFTVRFGLPWRSTFSASATALTLTFTASATSETVQFVMQPGSGAVGDFIEIDDISLKEMRGHHLVAPSDNQRPVVAAVGGRQTARFDGVDDTLSAAVPSTALGYVAMALQSVDQGGVPVMASHAVGSNLAVTAWDLGTSSILNPVSVDGGATLPAVTQRPVLQAAVAGANRPVVLEILPTVTSLTGYSLMALLGSAYYAVAGDLYGAVLLPAAPSAAERALVRHWLAGLSGAVTQ